jgi:hypothetical protein
LRTLLTFLKSRSNFKDPVETLLKSLLDCKDPIGTHLKSLLNFKDPVETPLKSLLIILQVPKQRWELYHECLVFFAAVLQLVGPQLGSPTASGAMGAMGAMGGGGLSRQSASLASPLPAYALFSTPGSAASRRMVSALDPIECY